MGNSGRNNDRFGSMLPRRPYLDVRPSRSVRLIEQGGNVVAYPEPHRTPVLPCGWGPLTRDQQDAVLQACDEAPHSVVFRVGSLWDADTEYRVYHLTDERWAGLWVATRYLTTVRDHPGASSGDNLQLLGLGPDALHALQITVDFFNWDLAAHGEHWRLSLEPPAPAVDEDPRR